MAETFYWISQKRGRKDKTVALANGPFFEIAGICQPLGAGVNDLPLTLVVSWIEQSGRDPVELAPRLEVHLPRSDCPRLGKQRHSEGSRRLVRYKAGKHFGRRYTEDAGVKDCREHAHVEPESKHDRCASETFSWRSAYLSATHVVRIVEERK